MTSAQSLMMHVASGSEDLYVGSFTALAYSQASSNLMIFDNTQNTNQLTNDPEIAPSVCHIYATVSACTEKQILVPT